jgi:hypothetical protein
MILKKTHVNQNMSSTKWLFVHYFGVGVIYGGVPILMYNTFVGYMDVTAQVFESANATFFMPWSLKFVVGYVSDTVYIGGRRRKPYMILGWIVAGFSFLCANTLVLPPSRYCDVQAPCGDVLPSDTAEFIGLLLCVSSGLVLADVAGDGLMIQSSRNEAKESHTQASAYVARSIGSTVATLTAGALMNGREYNGTSETGLSFGQMCNAFAVVCAIMAAVCSFFLNEQTRTTLPSKEPEQTDGADASSPKSIVSNVSSQAVAFVCLYDFFGVTLAKVRSPSNVLVKRYWARVDSFSNSILKCMAGLLSTAVLVASRRHLRDADWMLWTFFTQTAILILDIPMQGAVIFSYARSPMAYIGETLATEIPETINFIVFTFVASSLCEEGCEATLVVPSRTNTATHRHASLPLG